MHFRDLLDCSPRPSTSEDSHNSENSIPDQPLTTAQGITRTLRYTNTAGDLLYTIHADDVAVWNTKAYYDVSRRLDLENTRAVEANESVVLENEHDLGTEPMVWQLVNAEFAILEEARQDVGSKEDRYQELPSELLSTKGETPTSPPCSLVTLTYTSAQDEGEQLPESLTSLQDRVLAHMGSLVQYRTSGKVYSTLYRHLPERQPNMHPVIAEGKDGNGSWVACVLMQTDFNGSEREKLKFELDGHVERWKSQAMSVGRDIKVGVWKGEILMS